MLIRPILRRLVHREGNGPPNQTSIQGLYYANWDLIKSLDNYEPASLLKELERRRNTETNADLKLLLAASRGSSQGALMLLDAMKSTDFETVRRVHVGLRHTLFGFKEDQPDWIVSTALADQRYVTDFDCSGPELLTISYHADEDGSLTLALGHVKCKKAVPFLIQMCRDAQGARGPVMSLGDIGDRRAIPVLLECLRRAGAEVEYQDGYGLPDRFSRPVYALASLKAQEAVPELLKYIAFPEVIESLATIGDLRAVEPLEQLVANDGRITRNNRSIYPQLADKRVVAAKISLACLDKENGVSTLCKLLSDTSFGEFQRREVVWRLGHRRDPRAIPFLVKAIKTDASGSVVNQAITVLSVFKYKTAVDGLIECFDANFEGKADWKRAYTPEMFRENIAQSLHGITGHELGPDKGAWHDGWRENRDAIEGNAIPPNSLNGVSP